MARLCGSVWTAGKCAVGVTLPTGGYRDQDRRGEIQDAMIETMVRLERAFRPRIQALRGS